MMIVPLTAVDVPREDRNAEFIVMGGMLRPLCLSLVRGERPKNPARVDVDIAFIGRSGMRSAARPRIKAPRRPSSVRSGLPPVRPITESDEARRPRY